MCCVAESEIKIRENDFQRFTYSLQFPNIQRRQDLLIEHSTNHILLYSNESMRFSILLATIA